MKRLKLGADADNVRVDERASQVYVGYGAGALAVIDPRSAQKLADVPLPGHPESFRLEANGPRIFVNVPDANAIAIIDRGTLRAAATWKTPELHANFPLAPDEDGRVIAVFRKPARLALFRPVDGKLIASFPTCGDADDVFVDAQRHLLYVICGSGAVDIFAKQGEGYGLRERITTAPGARTGLFAPETDRLYIAVPARTDQSAAIWVLRPN